jgi:hypothetical protein
MALAAEQGFAVRIELARILRGWALAMQGDVTAGVAQIRQRGTSTVSTLFSHAIGGSL